MASCAINSRGRRTLYLDYSGYEPMALRQMEQLAADALARFADSRCAHRAPAGALTDRRKQRLYCSFVGASSGGLRRLPLAHRHLEDHGADLEERVFRRRRGVGRRRTVSAGNPARGPERVKIAQTVFNSANAFPASIALRDRSAFIGGLILTITLCAARCACAEHRPAPA